MPFQTDGKTYRRTTKCNKVRVPLFPVEVRIPKTYAFAQNVYVRHTYAENLLVQ